MKEALKMQKTKRNRLAREQIFSETKSRCT